MIIWRFIIKKSVPKPKRFVNIIIEEIYLDASSRIVVNTPDLKLMFEGTIDNQGNCKVPIRKLRGLLGENDKGIIKLPFS